MESLLEILLLILRLLQEELFKSLVSVVLEVLGILKRSALISHLLQGLELWPLQHLWCQLLAIERVIHPLFKVSIDLFLSPLWHGSCQSCNLLVGDVVLRNWYQS